MGNLDSQKRKNFFRKIATIEDVVLFGRAGQRDYAKETQARKESRKRPRPGAPGANPRAEESEAEGDEGANSGEDQ